MPRMNLEDARKMTRREVATMARALLLWAEQNDATIEMAHDVRTLVLLAYSDEIAADNEERKREEAEAAQRVEDAQIEAEAQQLARTKRVEQRANELAKPSVSEQDGKPETAATSEQGGEPSAPSGTSEATAST